MNRRQALKLATVALGGIASPGLLQAIQAADIAPANPKTFFNPLQANQVSLLAEMIIPTTTTPGAIDAGVPAFIDMMVGHWYTPTERKIFVDGLAAIDDYCQSLFNQGLINCNVDQLTQALRHAEDIAKAHPPAVSAPLIGSAEDETAPFFTKLKELVVLGYFSSELGITQSLAYDPMPMSYRADISLAEAGGKQWAQY